MKNEFNRIINNFEGYWILKYFELDANDCKVYTDIDWNYDFDSELF